MIYLITGSNGAGKTLNALQWVRERQLKENRPVAHNGRFELVPVGELSSWKQIDFKDWESEPDGTIFLIDECHNDMPTMSAGAAVPEPIKMLAEHRRRGMDFYLVTQHPQNIHSFVRRLIGAPGWHRHLKRSFGADMVSVLEWPAVNPQCEKNGSGKTGTVTMKAFPKQVYNWYKSASLHTSKKRIPWQLWFIPIAIVLLIFVLYLAVKMLLPKASADQGTNTKPAASTFQNQPQNQQYPATQQASTSATPAPKTRVEYIRERIPRIAGYQHTAPVYDEVTKPVVAPYPAACIQTSTKCECYTQQGTYMATNDDQCKSIVKRGFFIDWQQPQQPQQAQLQPQQPQPVAQQQRYEQPQFVPPPAPNPSDMSLTRYARGYVNQLPDTSHLQGK